MTISDKKNWGKSYKRIDQARREQISGAEGTAKDIALRYDVSYNTARRWKGKEAVAKSNRPRKLRGQSLNDFEKAVIFEVARLTRYPGARLMNYLPAVLRKLDHQVPTQEAVVSQRTFYRTLKDLDIKFKQSELISGPGTLGIHGIRVQWQQLSAKGTGEPVDGFILAVADRHTGYIYAKALKELEPKLVVNLLKQFCRYWPFKITTAYFVTTRFKVNGKPTAIGRGDPYPINNYFKGNEGEVLDNDPPTVDRDCLIDIPGSFETIKHLNKAIRKFLNQYNCGSLDSPSAPLRIIHELDKIRDPEILFLETRKKVLFPPLRIR